MNAFGPYRVLRRLGAGAFGEVFEVEHQETRARFALKALFPLQDSDQRARFAREAEALGRLDHPHVARTYSADLSGARPYLVQELLEGSDLGVLLRRRGRLPLADALRLIREVGAGLEHAHQAGVLHRDLKPENVLLDASGHAKLVDFGLAQLSGASRLTETHALLGTPAYMAPEQALGERLDQRCDVYALGALLFALVTGEAPFSNRGSVLALLSAVTSEAPPKPSDLSPGLPPWLDRLCLRSLAKGPTQRPESAQAFLDALEAPEAAREGGRLWVAGALGVGGIVAVACALALIPWRPATPPASPRAAASLSALATPSPGSTRAAPRGSSLARLRGLETELEASRRRCGAWFRGELELVTLDGRGRAQSYSLPDETDFPRELFDLGWEPPTSSGRLWGLFRRDGGWFPAVPSQPAHFVVRGGVATAGALRKSFASREVGLGFGLRAGKLLALSGEDLYGVLAWDGVSAPEPLFSVEAMVPPRRVAREEGVLDGGVVLPGDEAVLCWSDRQLFVWRKGLAEEVIDRARLKPHGLIQAVACAPGGDRFALLTRGSQVFLGHLSRDEPWPLLPVIALEDVTHYVGERALAFAGEDLLYAVGQIGARVGTELSVWDLSAEEPRLVRQRTWLDGATPVSLSLSRGGDLVAIGLSSGKVRLIGAEAIPLARER